MGRLERSVALAASAEDVWALVGSFGDLDTWHPWVPNCTLGKDGITRTIDLGPMSAVEVLKDEGPLHHSYTVTKGPMPITDYLATWTAAPTDGGCTLTVVATFTPVGVSDDDAGKMLSGFFKTAFKVLGERFGEV